MSMCESCGCGQEVEFLRTALDVKNAEVHELREWLRGAIDTNGDASLEIARLRRVAAAAAWYAQCRELYETLHVVCADCSDTWYIEHAFASLGTHFDLCKVAFAQLREVLSNLGDKTS